jgi:hypothetical protein
VIKLLLPLLLSQWQTQGIRVNDESAVQGYATQVNCTGTGVTCTSNGTVWTLNAAAAGGGGAPTTAQYWVGAADAGLSAEKDLSALATGLVLNTAGTPSAYGGATCTAPNFVRVISASGAATCAAPTLALSSVSNPTGDTTFTFPSGNKILWEFSGATDYAFSIHGTGAFTGTGDLVHLHLQGTPGVTAGADVLHLEWEDVDALGLRLNGPAGSQAAKIEGTGRFLFGAGANAYLYGDGTGITTPGAITATGGFVGNASTATALAADPSDCAASNYATGINASGVPVCSIPPGTYSLPDATSVVKGGVFLTGDLGGTAASPAVVDDSHAHTTTTISGLDAANDFTAGLLPVARGGTNASATPTLGGVAYGSGTAYQFTAAPASTGQCFKSGAVTATTLEWGSCSAGGGYATVQEEGGALTQRTALNFIGSSVTCADNAGSTRTDCTFTDAGALSGLTAGGAMYATSTTAIASTGTGTSGRSTLTSGGTGAPTWVQGTRGVTMTQDRTINATTAASTTDLTWAINANEGQTFTCALTSTSTATSKIRYAVAGPTAMTYMNCRVLLGTTSLTTLVANTIQGQWASTCTNCTNSVTASVLTTKITDTLECSVTNGANAGNITIYFADSTAAQVNTLHKGSGCLVTGGG